MAKQHVAEQETLGEAMNRTELFFEKNGRNMAYIFLGSPRLSTVSRSRIRIISSHSKATPTAPASST